MVEKVSFPTSCPLSMNMPCVSRQMIKKKKPKSDMVSQTSQYIQCHQGQVQQVPRTFMLGEDLD